MNNLVKLHLHKNTKEKREIQELRGSLKHNARAMGDDKNLAGYLLITWDKEAIPNTAWRTGKKSPVKTTLLAQYASNSINQILSEE